MKKELNILKSHILIRSEGNVNWSTSKAVDLNAVSLTLWISDLVLIQVTLTDIVNLPKQVCYARESFEEEEIFISSVTILFCFKLPKHVKNSLHCVQNLKCILEFEYQDIGEYQEYF